MARLNKQGIDYFSFDVDFFQDEKIQFISARFGLKGEIIAIRLLCKIYRNGYYTEFNDDTTLLFAKSVGDGCQDTIVKDVAYELVKRGFFDKSMYDRFGILTSRGIQNRYFEATKRYKSVNVIGEYLLVEPPNSINVHINSINVSINPINVHINSQRERENKIKRNNTIPPTPLSGGTPTFGEACDEISPPVNPAETEEPPPDMPNADTNTVGVHNLPADDANAEKQQENGESGETPKRPKPKKASAAFTPPAVAEVSDYCAERKNGIDASQFVDFYTSKGWMVGSNKMRDWKAAVRTWEKRNQNQQQFKPKKDEQEYRKTFGTDWGTSSI
jgi:hypothetical protein